MPALPPPSTLSLVAFLFVVAGVVGAFLYGARSPRVSAGTVAWIAATGLAPVALANGVPAQAFFAVLFVAAVAVAFSPVGTRLSEQPLAALIGVQAFRVPLELVLHDWVATGTAPPQMTWTGDNWDIASGLVALAAVPFARSRPAVWVANVVGFVLLLNVIRVVATSTPGPLQAYPDPILLAFHFPTVWIASVCVVGAVIGHLVTFRALLRAR